MVCGVHAGEHCRAGRDAGRAGAEGLGKGHSFAGQAVHVGRDHVVIAPGSDRVKALLVGHDQDDVWLFGKERLPFFTVTLTVLDE